MNPRRETKRVQLEANGPDLVKRIRALNRTVAKIVQRKAVTRVVEADYDRGRVVLVVTGRRRLPKPDRMVTMHVTDVGHPG